MRERMQDIGGDCLVQGMPGKGTRIRFVLPLNSALKGSDQNTGL
jgi:signal transduction histidine kinase